jgi:hypothetical protein
MSAAPAPCDAVSPSPSHHADDPIATIGSPGYGFGAAPRLQGGMRAPNFALIASMNVFASRADPSELGWMPSSPNSPPVT